MPDATTQVKEIVMVGVGHKKRRPFLFVLIDQDLVIYECFHFNKQNINGHLIVRFKRVRGNKFTFFFPSHNTNSKWQVKM